MLAKLEDILPDLYNKYPNVSPEMIDKIIEIYFKDLKRTVRNLDTPEIATMWGTLYCKKIMLKNKIALHNVILANRDTDKNKQSEARLKHIEEMRDKMVYLLEKTRDIQSKGKIERKKKRFKTNKNESKSTDIK